MKKKKYQKILFILLIAIIFFKFLDTSEVVGVINSNYSSSAQITVEDNSQSFLGSVANILMKIIYPIFTSIEDVTSVIMMIFTGSYFFPWADKVIFNTVSFLDVNFINPSPGSLFLKSDGVTYTIVGESIRKVYFTILAICLAFLGIAVAVNAIKLMFTTIGGEKAKYKQALTSSILTIVLLFGMHYLISFVFYINEQLVEVASDVMQNTLSEEDVLKANENIDKAENENNERLVGNFCESADVTSPSPITVAKKIVKEAVNFVEDACEFLKKTFTNTWDKLKDIFGWGDDEEEKKLSSDDVKKIYEDIFPSKDDVIKTIYSYGDEGINVASYLLKDYYYRDAYLWSVAGNDTNKFSNGGIGGTLTSFSNTVVWASGIIDTGLMGLENLCESTHYICVTMKEENAITSAADYKRKINYLAEYVHSPGITEEEENTARIIRLYYDAYYKYVYDGDDKESISITSFFSGLGEYFQRQSYYTDVDKGDWCPSTYAVIPSILYCVFLVQSFLIFFNYIKRMFYVIILAILGPVVVVYDYIFKSY